MAMLFTVRYPNGELAIATGYPHTLLVLLEVPRGPESCLFDEVEVDFENGASEQRVLRVAAGPRRPTLRVRLDAGLDPGVWMDARDEEGFWTSTAPDDPDEIWVARSPSKPATWTAVSEAPAGDLLGTFDRDGLDQDRNTLLALGARVVS